MCPYAILNEYGEDLTGRRCCRRFAENGAKKQERTWIMKLTPELLSALQRAIEHYGNTSQFAKHLGIAHSTVLFWLNGKTSNISGHIWISKMRRELRPYMNGRYNSGNCVREDIAPFRESALNAPDKRVAMLNFSGMADFDSTLEAPLSFIRSRSARQTQFANAGRDCFFALELDDPRSCPFLPLGTRILVSGGDYAENGDIVIAKLRNPQALVFCRYLRDNDMIRLIPLNPEYPAMEWPNSENAEKVFWMYPVAEISIDLLNNKWKDGRLVLREDQETAD